jgi:hypothetical protein
MPSVPDRYRGRDQDELPLLALADALDPPPAEEAAADPERWRQAVIAAQASLGLSAPVVASEAPRASPMAAPTSVAGIAEHLWGWRRPDFRRCSTC